MDFRVTGRQNLTKLSKLRSREVKKGKNGESKNMECPFCTRLDGMWCTKPSLKVFQITNGNLLPSGPQVLLTWFGI